ncbi:hypothetical protein AMTRI_Chr02g258760 [Amborella trichopoda]|uniref:PGG domain-containing protein n=1 Tax=Amborella trichopoda TaxID=13333 RepID=U5DA89_AMBTC|nr:hypothetical protein AMTR_s00037p00072620 [Amborella trichopoda]
MQELLLACPDSVELLDEVGHNAFHVAAENDEPSIIMHACRRSELAELLNEPDGQGNTVLHITVRKENSHNVNLLLDLPNLDFRAMNSHGDTALDITAQKGGHTYEQVAIWKALEIRGAARGRRRQSQEPRQHWTSEATNESYKTMANTLALVATLIAIVTFAAAFTMPGETKTHGHKEGTTMFLHKAAFRTFVVADTVAMCSSMVVALVLVWAVPSVLGMLANAVGWGLRLLWVALGGMVVTFVTAVYVTISPDCMWLVVVCVMGCSVPFLVAPIVTLSACQSVPKKAFQYDQIQAPLR